MDVRKCTVQVRSKIEPVAGSEREGKGTCPRCLTPGIQLSKKGFIGAHKIKVDVDPTIPVTDSGQYVGSPRDAAIKREVQGALVRAGTLPVPKATALDPVMTTGHGRGPTLVRGRNMEARVVESGVGMAPEDMPCEPTPERDTDEPHSNTMAGNLGRPHFDPVASSAPVVKSHRTKSSRKNWRRKQRRAASK